MIHTAVKILQDKGATDIEINSPPDTDWSLISYNYRDCAYGFKIHGLEMLQNNTLESGYNLVDDKFNFLLSKVPQNG